MCDSHYGMLKPEFHDHGASGYLGQSQHLNIYTPVYSAPSNQYLSPPSVEVTGPDYHDDRPDLSSHGANSAITGPTSTADSIDSYDYHYTDEYMDEMDDFLGEPVGDLSGTGAGFWVPTPDGSSLGMESTVGMSDDGSSLMLERVDGRAARRSPARDRTMYAVDEGWGTRDGDYGGSGYWDYCRG